MLCRTCVSYRVVNAVQRDRCKRQTRCVTLFDSAQPIPLPIFKNRASPIPKWAQSGPVAFDCEPKIPNPQPPTLRRKSPSKMAFMRGEIRPHVVARGAGFRYRHCGLWDRGRVSTPAGQSCGGALKDQTQILRIALVGTPRTGRGASRAISRCRKTRGSRSGSGLIAAHGIAADRIIGRAGHGVSGRRIASNSNGSGRGCNRP